MIRPHRPWHGSASSGKSLAGDRVFFQRQAAGAGMAATQPVFRFRPVPDPPVRFFRPNGPWCERQAGSERIRVREASARTRQGTTLRLRLFTLNAKGGAADPAVILRILQQYEVDVLAVQELNPPMVTRLAAAGLTRMLPFSHLDLRPGGQGAGLWARWPLNVRVREHLLTCLDNRADTRSATFSNQHDEVRACA